MKISSFFVVLPFAAILNPVTVSAACVQPPSCNELGFTVDASKCSGSFLKCPWDLSKAACEEVVKTPLPVLYGDGTLTHNILKGKTPIGIVFDEANRLAVALTDINKDGTAGGEKMHWANNYYDLPTLDTCADSRTLDECGADGQTNTNIILKCFGFCNGTPAATACGNYQPDVCVNAFCMKNMWFLPSIKELMNIYKKKNDINKILSLLENSGARVLEEYYYWSSTEGGYDRIWMLSMADGNRGNGTKNDNFFYVRPVVKY